MHVNYWDAPRQAAIRVALALSLTAMGCRREEVTHFRVPKPAPRAAGSPAAPATVPAGMSGEVAPPPPASQMKDRLTWTLPEGWKQEISQGGMRYASLRPPAVGAGKIDGSVVVLPGPAGGELANVNRWRGQIGLPPVDDAALSAARQILKTSAGPVSVYDFASDGEKKSRMVAATAEANGSTWFLKLTGDAEPVAAAKPAFLRLLETIRRAP